MTNAEKYEEVFGFPPDTTACPTWGCSYCPEMYTRIGSFTCRPNWWNEEYKDKN